MHTQNENEEGTTTKAKKCVEHKKIHSVMISGINALSPIVIRAKLENKNKIVSKRLSSIFFLYIFFSPTADIIIVEPFAITTNTM